MRIPFTRRPKEEPTPLYSGPMPSDFDSVPPPMGGHDPATCSICQVNEALNNTVKSAPTILDAAEPIPDDVLKKILSGMFGVPTDAIKTAEVSPDETSVATVLSEIEFEAYNVVRFEHPDNERAKALIKFHTQRAINRINEVIEREINAIERRARADYLDGGEVSTTVKYPQSTSDPRPPIGKPGF